MPAQSYRYAVERPLPSAVGSAVAALRARWRRNRTDANPEAGPLGWVPIWLGLFATVLSMPMAATRLGAPDGGQTGGPTVSTPSAAAPASAPVAPRRDDLHSLARFTSPLAAPAGMPANAAGARSANESALADKRLAVARNNQPLLRRAIAGYRRALDYYLATGDSENAGIVSANLLSAMLVLEGRPAAQISVSEVQALARAALAATDGTPPLTRSRLLIDIGTLLLASGARNEDAAAVEQAVAAFRSGLRDAQHDGRSPREWAAAENLLGNALEFLGQTKGSRPLLNDSLKAIRNAWVLYQYAGLDQYRFFFDARISALEADLGQLAEGSGSPAVRPQTTDIAALR